MNVPLNPATSAKAVGCTGSVALMFMAVLFPFAPVCGAAANATDVKVVSTPAASSSQPLYTGNREPLLPSPLIKLPIGSITPKGWLRHQLELEAQGMTGRLAEISQWCKFEGNAWADPQGKGKRLGGAAVLAQRLRRPGLCAEGPGDHQARPQVDRCGAGQPGGGRLVRPARQQDRARRASPISGRTW